MDGKLLEAARLGDVTALENLINEDPLILDKVFLRSSSETPLQVASLVGHVEFVKKLISLKPLLALKADKDGLTPLHLASARGQLEIASHLLSIGQPENLPEAVVQDEDDLCLKKDKEGRTPLHLAAMNGRVQMLELLLSCCPASITEVTACGKTALHVAVKNSQFKAFKTLFEFSETFNLDARMHEELINANDENGATILQLARSIGEMQVMRYLKRRQYDVDREGGILEKLIPASEPANPESRIINVNNLSTQGEKKNWRSSLIMRLWVELAEAAMTRDEDLGIVSSVIATATYQAAISPPASIWKQGVKFEAKCIWAEFKWKHTDTHDILDLKSCPAYAFYAFMLFNTIGFMASIFLILFSRVKKVRPILLLVSLLSLFVNYLYLMGAVSENRVFYGVVVFIITLGIFYGLPCFISIRTVADHMDQAKNQD